MDERHQRVAESGGVEPGVVAGDDAGFFKRAQAAQAGRGREADAVGEFLVADASVLLEVAKHLTVDAVNLHDFFLKGIY